MAATSQLPQIRFLVACPRSGSTLLMRIFTEASTCAVTSRLVVKGNHEKFEGKFVPAYSILENPQDHNVFLRACETGKHFLINKEEMGNDTRKGECTYDVFPDASAYERVRPVFLIRDPLRIFDSWKKVGWCDIESFVDCYTNTFRMIHESPESQSRVLVYEKMIQDPAKAIKEVCDWWGVPFTADMLHFKKEFGSFEFNSEREKRIYQKDKPLGLFSTVEAHSSVQADIRPHGLLSNDEKYYLDSKLGKMYLSCWSLDTVARAPKDTAWFAFDLDDTLHEFRKASGVATDATLSKISETYGTPPQDLKSKYSEMLLQKTSAAFVDGKTSTEYRRDRFAAVLDHFSLPSDILGELLIIYEAQLNQSLELKPGALDLLRILKSMGKKVAVITEGPQDAQEKTVDALGLRPYVDFLATTNFFRVSKIDGLYAKVLKHLEIRAEYMVMIGDNEQRDVVPALKEGIYAVHYAENDQFSLDTRPVKINSLKKLELILSD